MWKFKLIFIRNVFLLINNIAAKDNNKKNNASSNRISKQQQPKRPSALTKDDGPAPGDKSKRSVTSELFNKLITYPNDDDEVDRMIVGRANRR